jgi:hypothetical protein|tara:strand:+ start:1108 stop:1416 length:309 start_codon:yes stop_codon:yes gene_type:complete
MGVLIFLTIRFNGGSMILFAEGLGIGDLVNGGPWLVVAWVTYHLLTKSMPRQNKEIKGLHKEINKLKSMMIYHDATVRGINSELSGSNDELKKLGEDSNGDE